MRAAVIVPTRDRPQSLARCLAALEQQKGPAELEVVVVDDGSVVAEEVATVVARSSRARLLRRDRAGGPAAARNDGVRATDAHIVLFTDDDCEPTGDWARRLSGAIENGADVAAGTTLNGRPDDALASASEAILSFVQLQAHGPASTTTFAATNNLGCKRRVLAEIPFDEEYRYGEDRDWCARVVAAGRVFVVEPGAAVLHHQELTIGDFWRKHLGYGRGAYRFRRQHASQRGLESPRFYGGLLRRGFAAGTSSGLLVGLAQIATAVGFVREGLAERRRS
jgi:GT2 family glycosyltransferase